MSSHHLFCRPVSASSLYQLSVILAQGRVFAGVFTGGRLSLDEYIFPDKNVFTGNLGNAFRLSCGDRVSRRPCPPQNVCPQSSPRPRKGMPSFSAGTHKGCLRKSSRKLSLSFFLIEISELYLVALQEYNYVLLFIY